MNIDRGSNTLSTEVFTASIPEEMKAEPAWTNWGRQWDNLRNKWGKVFYVPKGSGYDLAKSNDPATWGSFEEAVAMRLRLPHRGLGFVMSKGRARRRGKRPLVGIDIDNCLDEHGNPSELAVRTINLFDCYVEITPSGRGLRIYVFGEIPRGRRNQEAGIEVYDDLRFFTVTGRWLPGCPPTINERQAGLDALFAEFFADTDGPTGAADGQIFDTAPVACTLSDDAIITLCRAARNCAKFIALFDLGDTSLPPYLGNHSNADAGLLRLLAWYTQDVEQLDRLFRQSKLYRPEKWGRDTYRVPTLKFALRQNGGRHYSPPEVYPIPEGETLEGALEREERERVRTTHKGVTHVR